MIDESTLAYVSETADVYTLDAGKVDEIDLGVLRVSAVLDAAADVLDRVGWCRGVRHKGSVSAPDAVDAVDAVGAIDIAAGGLADADAELADRAVCVFAAHISDPARDPFFARAWISQWNDRLHLDDPKAHVQGALRGAARRLRASSQTETPTVAGRGSTA